MATSIGVCDRGHVHASTPIAVATTIPEPERRAAAARAAWRAAPAGAPRRAGRPPSPTTPSTEHDRPLDEHGDDRDQRRPAAWNASLTATRTRPPVEPQDLRPHERDRAHRPCGQDQPDGRSPRRAAPPPASTMAADVAAIPTPPHSSGTRRRPRLRTSNHSSTANSGSATSDRDEPAPAGTGDGQRAERGRARRARWRRPVRPGASGAASGGAGGRPSDQLQRRADEEGEQRGHPDGQARPTTTPRAARAAPARRSGPSRRARSVGPRHATANARGRPRPVRPERPERPRWTTATGSVDSTRHGSSVTPVRAPAPGTNVPEGHPRRRARRSGERQRLFVRSCRGGRTEIATCAHDSWSDRASSPWRLRGR